MVTEVVGAGAGAGVGVGVGIVIGFNAQTFLPDLVTQIYFFPALIAVALILVQDLFNNEAAELAGLILENSKTVATKPTIQLELFFMSS
jgi:hypothetical protein